MEAGVSLPLVSVLPGDDIRWSMFSIPLTRKHVYSNGSNLLVLLPADLLVGSSHSADLLGSYVQEWVSFVFFHNLFLHQAGVDLGFERNLVAGTRLLLMRLGPVGGIKGTQKRFMLRPARWYLFLGLRLRFTRGSPEPERGFPFSPKRDDRCSFWHP